MSEAEASRSGLQTANQLLSWMKERRRVVVAYSGGVDSSVVAAAAFRSLGENSLAVTANSPSVPAFQLELARRVAMEIGIRHKIVVTGETERPEYRQNDKRRCYYCKQSLYEELLQAANLEGDATVVSGTNHDDLGDWRPGIQAGIEAGVETPLVELKLGKSGVRQLARFWNLSIAELPASPCIASRIEYGVEVTPVRLMMVERAENWLRERGYTELRVRYHRGDLARIEVPLERLSELASANLARCLVKEFREIGFTNVTLDLAGLRSGNLNQLIQIQV